jgi:hypothetical protein
MWLAGLLKRHYYTQMRIIRNKDEKRSYSHAAERMNHTLWISKGTRMRKLAMLVK